MPRTKDRINVIRHSQKRWTKDELKVLKNPIIAAKCVISQEHRQKYLPNRSKAAIAVKLWHLTKDNTNKN